MKTISMPHGETVIVDDEHYDYLVNGFCWWLHKDSSHPLGYAQGQERGTGKKKYMQRVIMEREGFDVDGKYVDHIDLNTLDNRRCNLRMATKSQSQHNKRKQRNNTSGYKGVSWIKHCNKWCVQITLNGKHVYRGLVREKIDAAQAYLLLAFLHHGEFARVK